MLTTTAVSPSEAFKRLCIGRTLGYELLRTGALRGVKVGARKWVVPLSEIERYLQENVA